MALAAGGNTEVACGSCCCCVPNVFAIGWLGVLEGPKLNPPAGAMDVDPNFEDVTLSDGTVVDVAACPKKKVFANGAAGAAGAAVVTVTFDEPNDSVVAAGLIFD